MFYNTERRDTRPYASPMGNGLGQPRGGKWRLQNGTPNAAMRLKALSQAPLDNTRHPKSPRQMTTTQKKKPDDTQNPCTHKLPRDCVDVFPSTRNVRGGRRGIYTVRTCLNPTPLSSSMAHGSASQTPTPTDTRCPTLKSCGETKTRQYPHNYTCTARIHTPTHRLIDAIQRPPPRSHP